MLSESKQKRPCLKAVLKSDEKVNQRNRVMGGFSENGIRKKDFLFWRKRER